jgi:putative ABC transport system permease protein
MTVLQDLAYGLRLMRRAPGFTAAAVLTLGLGIGVNVATFSMVNVVSLKPLSYKDPGRVAFLLAIAAGRQQPTWNLPLADAIDLGRQMQSFDAVGAYAYWSANLTGYELPERIQAYRVLPNTFELLGVDAALGRTIASADGRPDTPDVVVLSYGLWERRFGANPGILGQFVTLDGRAHQVIGIMPRRFEFPVFNFKGEAWTAMKGTAEALASRPASPSIVAIARLRQGVSYTTAQSELNTVMAQLESDYPQTNRGVRARVIEMRRLGDLFQPAPVPLIALSAVAIVLLLACANVANLLLSRAAGRERELAVRASLGAGRGRLVRQLLTESALLAAAGAALGLAVAFWALSALRTALPELLIVTQPNVMELGIDRLTLAFTAAVAFGSAVVFGAIPALKTARTDLCASLKCGGHGTAGPRHQRLRGSLLVVEVALSLALLVASGLLARTVDRLHKVPLGFSADRVLTMTMTLPDYRYADGAAQRRFFERTAEEVARVPGVRAAGFVNALPFSTYNAVTRYIVESAPVSEEGREPAADYRIVTDGYFNALQIPLVAGRAFDGRDRETTQRVAMVNRTFERRALGPLPAVGQRIRLGPLSSAAPWLTIVGVVGDVRHSQITGAPEAEVYVPMRQMPAATMMLAVATAGNPPDLIDPVRRAIGAVDPSQPVYHIGTLRHLLDDAMLTHASAMQMMTAFGALAFVLVAVGIYGVVSYGVSQQMREFGIRLALGAAPAEVLSLVLRRVLALVLAGTAIGVTAALALGYLMAGLLYGVSPADLPSFAAPLAMMSLVALIACYVPARRAMRTDPIVTLRTD